MIKTVAELNALREKKEKENYIFVWEKTGRRGKNSAEKRDAACRF